MAVVRVYLVTGPIRKVGVNLVFILFMGNTINICTINI